MKIHLWSVGKSHEAYVKVGVDDFTNRISKYYPVEWKILPAAKQHAGSSEVDIKKQEAQTILQALQKDDQLILLDEKGKSISSPELATFIQRLGNESVKNVVFLIGGAFGVDDTVYQKARFQWSLSKLVFPHQLVRLILAEQVYRACSINCNEKYHHL